MLICIKLKIIKNINLFLLKIKIYIILFFLIFYVFFIVINWRKEENFLNLYNFIVIGKRYYTTNDDIRKSIFTFFLLGITQSIDLIQQIERIPWVKKVSVRKQLQDKFIINLVEYFPAAGWNDLYILDENCKVFNLPLYFFIKNSFTMLYGPEGSEHDVLSSYLTIKKLLTSVNFKLKAVSISAQNSFNLTLQDKTQIKLGREERVRRLQRFIGIYPMLVKQASNYNKCIRYVDLRYDYGFAVAWTSFKNKYNKQ